MTIDFRCAPNGHEPRHMSACHQGKYNLWQKYLMSFLYSYAGNRLFVKKGASFINDQVHNCSGNNATHARFSKTMASIMVIFSRPTNWLLPST